MSTRYIMAAYEIDREYGGPEEGGWWYDCGSLQRIIRIFKNEDEAFEACRRANHLIRLIQRGCREVGSVLYSGGRYQFSVYENIAPVTYPSVVPHYE